MGAFEMELAAQGLSVDRGERRVISGLDLALGASQSLVVTGANGAGKSTLLRALAGLVPRAGGALRLGGQDPQKDLTAYAGQLHFIGHRDGVKNTLSVGENLAAQIALLGGTSEGPERFPKSGERFSDRKRDLLLKSALDAFGLQAFAHLPVAYLSAGQKRRLALARLVAVPRALWLLDEPGAGLDAQSREALTREIARHCASGGMVVMASHGEMALAEARTLHLGRA